MADAQHPDPQLLLEHASWLRALAVRLTRDPHAAEDLVQDTWLAALQGPRRPVRAWRAWLGGALAHRARSERRGETRRRAREEASAPPEPALDPARAVEQAALGRELLDLVLALEEPFRGTLLLRYWEDLPPRAIAARLGVSVRTVDSRLARAHERLRERWTRRYGDDARAFDALVLVAFGARPLRCAAAAALPSTQAGALALLLMNTKVVVAAVLAVGSAGLLWLARTPEPAPIVAPVSQTVDEARTASELRAETAPLAPLRAAAEERVSVAPPPAHASAPADEPTPVQVFRGRVLGVDTAPRAGVTIKLGGPHEGMPVDGRAGVRATSGAGGWFELETVRTSGTLVCVDPELVTVFECVVHSGVDRPALVVVAERSALAGRVVDEAGAPLAGARVRALPPEGFASRFDARLDASALGEWSTASDADGRFALEPVPLFGGVLEARLEGFEPVRVPAPAIRDEGVVLVLRRPASESTTLAGLVLDSDGRPAPGSRVSLGGRSAVADAAGTFELDRSDALQATSLVAVRPGSLPARYDAPRDPTTGQVLWPASVTLVLGGEPLALEGRIVDTEGRPVPGLHVWIHDPTIFGIVGEDTEAQVEAMVALSQQDARDGILDEVYWAPTMTGGDGGFRIGGLLDRTYALRVMDSRTLVSALAGPFSPGPEPVTVVFDPGDPGAVAGRVTGLEGTPLSGVRVTVGAMAYGGVSLVSGVSTTDAEGRFRFERLGGTRRYLWLHGDEVAPLHVALEDGPQEDLEIAAVRRCEFKVDLGGRPDFADRLYVLGEDDERVGLYLIDAHGTTFLDSAPLVDGRSANLGVDEGARTLVLEKGGEEVRRVPIQLVPGRLEILQP